MKNLLLFLTIGFLTIGCANYAYADEVAHESAGSTHERIEGPATVRGLVRLGAPDENGDFSLIYAQDLTNMIVNIRRLDGTRLDRYGLNSDDVTVLMGSANVRFVAFQGTNSNGDVIRVGVTVEGFEYEEPITGYLPGTTLEHAITSPELFIEAVNANSGASSWYIKNEVTGGIIQVNRLCSEDDPYFSIAGTVQDGSQDLGIYGGAILGSITWEERCGYDPQFRDIIGGSEDFQGKISELIKVGATNFGGSVDPVDQVNQVDQVDQVDPVDPVDPVRDGSIVALAIRTQEEFSNAINGSLSSWYVENTLTGNILQFNRVCESAEGLVLSITGALDEADTYFSDNTWKAVFWHGDRCINTRTDFVTGAGIAGLQARISEYFLYTDATNFGITRDGSTPALAIRTHRELVANVPAVGQSRYVENTTTGDIIQMNAFCGGFTGLTPINVTGAAQDGSADYYVATLTGEWGTASWHQGRCSDAFDIVGHAGRENTGFQNVINAYIQNTTATNFRDGYVPVRNGSTVALAIRTQEEFSNAINGSLSSWYVENTLTGNILQFNRVCESAEGLVLSITGALDEADTYFSSNTWKAVFWHGDRCINTRTDFVAGAGIAGLQARISEYFLYTDATNFGITRDGSTPALAIRTHREFVANLLAVGQSRYVENTTTGDIIQMNAFCGGFTGSTLINVTGAAQDGSADNYVNIRTGFWGAASWLRGRCSDSFKAHQTGRENAGFQSVINAYIQYTTATNFRD
ncbi:hypothetical protein [Pelagibaculum spongiae]|uniref:Uncharacterized protein n=1 Tax=Pelagibaculum spongiae TaxID=2080658 RepID=A0A2V1GZG4_9GAMM|nr:hypothetical protein [Pelagibaculum spongiae]PVZ68762.1 hypothetical protein DC094_10920 [Pelagibaculum spongiae]